MSNDNRKIALVTGSSKGIGSQIAKELASKGIDIILHYFTDEQAALDVKNDITQRFNTNVYIVGANLADKDDIKNMFKEISSKVDHLDILINNAASGVHKPVLKLRKKDWDWTINVNGSAPLFCVQEAVKMMSKSESYIINITSMGSRRYIPNYGAVGCSKSILESLSRYLAVELANDNVIVNTVAGGVVDTEALKSFPTGSEILQEGKEKTPAGRIINPGDIAKVVSFLVSGNADMIRGQTIIVDGGYSLL